MKKYDATLEQVEAMFAITDASTSSLKTLATIKDITMLQDLKDFHINMAKIVDAIIESKERFK